ncbi:MAG TPA: transcriptional regulator [Duganella sp.]|jgi:HTH-type transcriptional regulator/antitoxin HigA
METLTDHAVVAEITSRYEALSSLVPLRVIRNEQEYEGAVSALNRLLDAGAADDDHPLADLLSALGNFIGDYEDRQYPPDPISALEMIRFLMDQHHLSESELPEIGEQDVVSEVLNGKRELNVRQIKELSSRFNVPASLFI